MTVVTVVTVVTIVTHGISKSCLLTCAHWVVDVSVGGAFHTEATCQLEPVESTLEGTEAK